MDNCWYYTQEIERYLADKKMLNVGNVPKNHLEIVSVKNVKKPLKGNGKVGHKKMEQAEADFQQALIYFNGKKAEKVKP